MGTGSFVERTGRPSVSTSLDELVGKARALCENGDRVILGIVGPPGSGKSTLAAQVASRLPNATSIVGMDAFHLANSELHRLGRSSRKGAIDTFDAYGYLALLERLLRERDRVVYAPVFDRGLEEAIGSAWPVAPDVELVITEGLYLLDDSEPWAAVPNLLSESWYCELEDSVRVPRLVQRHVRFGRSPKEAEEWAQRSDEVNAVRVAASRPRCDVLVDIARVLEPPS
jgi:pantothenate kinase